MRCLNVRITLNAGHERLTTIRHLLKFTLLEYGIILLCLVSNGRHLRSPTQQQMRYYKILTRLLNQAMELTTHAVNAPSKFRRLVCSLILNLMRIKHPRLGNGAACSNNGS